MPSEIAKRRTNVTPAKYDRMLAELAKGDTPTIAAETAGMSVATANRHRNRDPEFAEKYAQAVAEGIDRIEQRLVGIARGEIPIKNSAEVTAIFGVLRKRAPELWRDNVKHEVAGQIDLKVKAAVDEFDREWEARVQRVRAIEASSNGDS